MKKSAFVLFLLLSSCYNYGQLEYVTELPKALKENSGLEILPQSDLFWFIADGGNKDHLYGIDLKGDIIKDINIKGAKNQDWEDLAADEAGNIFIGDFGNNNNEREDLVIYRIPNPVGLKKEDLDAEEINFWYPEQKEFPPDDEDFVYDAEAFFFFDGHLYIFTKNRTYPFDGRTLLYKVPAIKGEHKAILLGETVLCKEIESCMVTAADISPDRTKVVLLSHDRIWLLQNFKEDDFFGGQVKEIPLGHYSQKESISFKTNELVYISDEKTGPTGKNLYSFDISKF
ncbi:hypothetical protein ACJD0Z_16370 [Flavobacteriaceae bacterium M23B6Z8]